MSSTSTAFTYNDANELTSMVENGVLTTNFTYDDWGRTTSKTQGAYEATYDWRYGDKLKLVESDFPGEAATVSYIYDGLGKRRTKYVNGSDWTHYRWDRGWNMIAEYDDGGGGQWDIGDLANTFIPGLAEVPGANPATGDYHYYMTDRLGSVRGILSQSQGTLAAYDYSPYGEPFFQAGLALNKGFTGHTWEAQIGQYYAPYRYYGSGTGRWLSRDPLGFIDGPNLYSYAVDNPIALSDRLGLHVCIDLETGENVCRKNPNCPEKSPCEHTRDGANGAADCQACCEKKYNSIFYIRKNRDVLTCCYASCATEGSTGKDGKDYWKQCKKSTPSP